MYQRIVDALYLRMPDKIPLWLYIDHAEFITDASGIDYYEHPMQASKKLIEMYDIDIGLGPLSDEPIPRPEEQTEDRTESEDGSIKSKDSPETAWQIRSPFTSVEEVLNFSCDPFAEDAEKAMYPSYAVSNYKWLMSGDWDEKLEEQNKWCRDLKRLYPGHGIPASGLYTTCFMWPIMIFGWDLFLEAGGLYPEKMGEIIGRFSEITRKYMEFYVETEQEFCVTHDDISMARGPVFNPKWYRKYVFPKYEYIFEPTRKKGIPVIFLSDGNYTVFFDDLAPIFDGFLFEINTSLETAIEKYGETKVIIGNADVRILQRGTEKDVYNEVKRCTDLGRSCPGYFLCCSNIIMRNVPLENVYAYFEAATELRPRR
jgi:hypothetical protein